jgi:RNA ligase (TIGR02306 family)
MRKLVTLRTISALQQIEGADLIQIAEIDGWQTIVKKNEFSVGDVGVYFEIDSFLSAADQRFNFLEKIRRTWEGNTGYRIKTIKLKKQISQGLLLPLHLFPEIVEPQFDTDYSELLNVLKWEAAAGASLYSDAAGLFPSFIPKTDAERVQNSLRYYEDAFAAGEEFEVSVKCDGSSMTCYSDIRFNGEEDIGESDLYVGVCSRNYDLKLPQPGEDVSSKFLQMFFELDIKTKLTKYYERTGKCIAIQGEIFGPGIQANFEGVPHYKYAIFNVYDIEAKRYMNPIDRQICITDLEQKPKKVLKNRENNA